jgi:diadenosine tetraphosphate (Ap4A) HIT family hydrolase
MSCVERDKGRVGCSYCLPTTTDEIGTQHCYFEDDLVAARLHTSDDQRFALSVAPRRHKGSMHELSTAEAAGLGRVMNWTARAVRHLYGPLTMSYDLTANQQGHLVAVMSIDSSSIHGADVDVLVAKLSKYVFMNTV